MAGQTNTKWDFVHIQELWILLFALGGGQFKCFLRSIALAMAVRRIDAILDKWGKLFPHTHQSHSFNINLRVKTNFFFSHGIQLRGR